MIKCLNKMKEETCKSVTFRFKKSTSPFAKQSASSRWPVVADPRDLEQNPIIIQHPLPAQARVGVGHYKWSHFDPHGPLDSACSEWHEG